MLTIRHVSDVVASPGCMIKSALGAYRQQQRQDSGSPTSAVNNSNVFVPLSAPCTPVTTSASNTLTSSLSMGSAGVTATPTVVHEITPLPSTEKKMSSILTMMPSAFVPTTPRTAESCAEIAPCTPVASVLDDTHDAAVLLTSMTAIARKEIVKEGCDLSMQDSTSVLSGSSPPPLPSFAQSAEKRDLHEETATRPATSSAFAARSILTLAPRTTPLAVDVASDDCRDASVCGFASSPADALELGGTEYPAHVLPSLSKDDDDANKTSPNHKTVAASGDESEGASRARTVSMEATGPQKFHPFQTGNLVRLSLRASTRTDEQTTAFNHVSPPSSPHSYLEQMENTHLVSPSMPAPVSPTTPFRARLADRRKRYMTERQEQGDSLSRKENSDVGIDAMEVVTTSSQEEELETASSREEDELTLKENLSSEDRDDTFESTEDTARKEAYASKGRRGKKRVSSVAASTRRSSSSSVEGAVCPPPLPTRSLSEGSIGTQETEEAKAKEASKSAANKKGKCLKTILRRKFSWKNYPELEAFLIANREEYLRHSALNYTVQQKQYNNRLTERLLELAGEHGYVFDEEAFSFVTVRDRIRCYFKSYVQSSKKRGVIIGYAARKAGLLTEDDLEKSANTAGRIVVPTTSTDEDCMSS